jgi:hypothetical protein
MADTGAPVTRHASVPEAPMSKDRPAQPTCPNCSKTVTQGDLVVFSHGDLVHLACHVSAGGLEEIVASFLRSSTGRRFCHSCLARALSLSWKDTAKIVTRLRVVPEFRVVTGQCGSCAELRVTIGAG